MTAQPLRSQLATFLKHDLKASITLFFVALPLCLGISLASGAPVYSGVIAGIIGGILVSLISKSALSVSGPAAGLTAICATAITDLGSIEGLFIAIALSGVFQIILGLARLGSFTQFIPSSVIKGMLGAIGIILITKQFPLVLGYTQPDFWTHELFNIITLNNSLQHINEIYLHLNMGVVIVSIMAMLILIVWKRYLSDRIKLLPASFVVVALSSLIAFLINTYFPQLTLLPAHFVRMSPDFFSDVKLADTSMLFENQKVWTTAIVICFVASLESLLSITAIDKLDPLNRITPPNRELMAQGAGNLMSGLIGGLPITAVIVRSSANAEAGAKTRLSAFTHGIWLLLAVILAIPLLNYVPYCVLAVILIRTGFNLAKPSMMRAVYKHGREQFLPFIVTLISILVTDILIGVAIGLIYALYFLIKHTYRAGYVVKIETINGVSQYKIDLALNVSFLNKKRFTDLLDEIPENSMVEINGDDSVYIDHDILEIFHDFKAKAAQRNILLKMHNIPDVETIELH